MVTTEVQAAEGAIVAQRWLARLALVAAVMAGLGLTLAWAWWALAHVGPVRGLAIALAVAAPLTVLVLYTRGRVAWVVLLALGLLALAVAAGRAALRRDAIPSECAIPGVPDPRPIMDWKRLWRIALTGRGQVRSWPW